MKIILLADDSETLRVLAVELLKQRGYVVEEVTNGDEVLEKIRSGLRPDIIVTDNNMARMSGLEVLKTLRENGEFQVFKNLPVIVWTDDDVKTSVEKFKGVPAGKNAENLIAAVDAVAADIAKEKG